MGAQGAGLRLIGIDLSLTSTGICVVNDGSITELDTIKSSGKKGDSITQRGDRMNWIVEELVLTHLFWENADLAVIEAPSYGSSFGSAHDRSGLWWLVVREIQGRGIPLALVSPQGRAKYGTGKGNSKKPEVYAAVKANYAELVPRPIKNNDEADAVLLACIGSRYLGYPVEPVSPGEANLASLTGVHWPNPEREKAHEA